MKQIRFAKSILAGLVGAGWLGLSAAAAPAQTSAMPFNLPLYFEANQGQVDSPAQFIARGHDFQFLISPDAAQFVFCKMSADRTFSARTVRMQFVGANSGTQISGSEELSGRINYLVGNDPARWQTGVATFAKVQVRQIYSGVNLTYYGNQQQLEYDFTVAPGADPGVIAIHFDGADKISVNPAGELILNVGDGELRQPKPVIYQAANGTRHEISGGYEMLDAHTVGFALGDYDHSQTLVIDPLLSYSTYFGGNADDIAWKVALDTNGFVYIAGQTLSSQFAANTPLSTHGAFQTNFAGGSQAGDAFVAKFSNDGSNLVYCTYLGGSADDAAYGLAVDAMGDVYITGATASPNFPTKNAIYTNISGVSIPHVGYLADAFVAELAPGGSNLVYSTYLGGASADAAYGIAVDLSGNAYVTGFSYSTNFPVTNAIQNHLACRPSTIFADNGVNAFVSKIGAGGSPLLYSTYFGGTNHDVGKGIAVDAAGNAYITGFTDSTNFPTTTNAFQTVLSSTNIIGGNNAFVAKFSPAGTSLIYSTFLGGTNNDQAFGIAVDGAFNAYVTGGTTSPNFPNTAANLSNGLTNNLNGFIVTTNAFLVKLDSAGTNIVYSAVMGGFAMDVGYGVAVDPAGNAFVCGASSSTNFPVTTNNIPDGSGCLSATNSGGQDAFVIAFTNDFSSVLYSAYLGGANNDFGYGVALDSLGNVYITGQTLSSNFRTNSARQAALNGPSDAFLAKIFLTVLPPVITTQPTNQTVGVGSTVNFVVSATGTPPLSYQWQLAGTNLVNGGSINGATNSTLTIFNADITNGGNYQVIVSNFGGATTSAVAVLTVTNFPVVITTQPTSQTNGVGSTVTFFVQGDGTEVSFQWFKNGGALVDGTNASGSVIRGATNNNVLEIDNAQTNDSGSYSIIVSNSVNSVTSSNAILLIVAAPTILMPPTSQIVGLGATVSFSVTAVGAAPLSYQWLMNGTNAVGGHISGANTNATLTITNTQTGNNGNSFSVIVTNLVGAVTSAPPAVLTVLTAPRFTTITSEGGTNFSISGIGGTNSGAFSILTTTNLALPLTNWTSRGSNVLFDNQGNFNFNYALTNALPHEFLILQLQ